MNMKKLLVLSFLILFLFSYNGFADETEIKPQTVCPVMGGKINKDFYLDYQSQRIYFCCPACKPEFLDDPEKYMQKIETNKVLLESVQEKCPVMGGKIDKNVYTDYKGRRVYFCCKACIESFEKDPENYLRKLE